MHYLTPEIGTTSLQGTNHWPYSVPCYEVPMDNWDHESDTEEVFVLFRGTKVLAPDRNKKNALRYYTGLRQSTGKGLSTNTHRTFVNSWHHKKCMCIFSERHWYFTVSLHLSSCSGRHTWPCCWRGASSVCAAPDYRSLEGSISTQRQVSRECQYNCSFEMVLRKFEHKV